jgi:hypothetical protein
MISMPTLVMDSPSAEFEALIERSSLIDLGTSDLAAQIDWPPTQ